MDIKDLKLNFARIQFYKPLAGKLHPAGAFSSVKAAFLRILNMYNYIVDVFNIFDLTSSGSASSIPQGLFPSGKLHSWIIRECIIVKTKVFFQGGCSTFHGTSAFEFES